MKPGFIKRITKERNAPVYRSDTCSGLEKLPVRTNLGAQIGSRKDKGENLPTNAFDFLNLSRTEKIHKELQKYKTWYCWFRMRYKVAQFS